MWSIEKAATRDTRPDLVTELPEFLCAGCESILYRGTTLCASCGQPQPDDGWPSLEEDGDRWLGRTLDGRWLLSRRLGRGATSAVYRAESLHVPRRFAIKIVSLEGSSVHRVQATKRASHEIDVVQEVESPHIVGIHEIFEPSRDHLALVMDFVEGTDLRTMIKRDGPIPPGQALDLARQIAEGLTAVHRAGVVHLDVKPANILVERQPDGSSVARLTDFGIAGVSGGHPAGFVGTPMFASPEQIVGDDVDHRSDIYSLGVTLFYILTGEAPFHVGNRREVMTAHVTLEPPRLSDVDGSYFSDALEGLMAQLLMKDPDDRPADVAELLIAFDEVERSERWQRVERGRLGDVPEELRTTAPHDARPRGHCMAQCRVGRGTTVGLTDFAGENVVAIDRDALRLTTFDPNRTWHRSLGFEAEVTALGACRDRIAIGLEDGRVMFVDVSGELVEVFRTPQRVAVTALAVSARWGLALCGTRKGDLFGQRSEGGEWELLSSGTCISSLALAGNGALMAVARRGTGIEMCDTGAGHWPLARARRSDVTSVALDRDGATLAFVQGQSVVSVYDVESSESLFKTRRVAGRLLSLRFAERSLLGVCADDEGAFVVDLQCEYGGMCRPETTHCHRREPDRQGQVAAVLIADGE